MDRMLAPLGIVLLTLATMTGGCSREEGKPAAKPAASPAVRATSPAPQAAATGQAEAEEVYLDLEAEPDEGAPPLSVKFTASIEEGTPPFTYKWEFGDGSPPSTEASPTHVYQKVGDYTATLAVRDSKGHTGYEEVDVLVEAE